MAYGSIFTEDDFKRQLYDLNRDYEGKRTWANMFQQAGLAAQQQQSALDYDYANAMSQAYLNSINSGAAISGSNVLQGNKQMLMDQNSLALQQAFEAYSKQHIEGSQQIAQNLAATNSSIDDALSEQAKYTADYANAHYSYLQKLYEDYENQENTIFDNALWSKYLIDEVDENGQPISKRLKTWNELTSAAKDENGEWTSLYDDNDKLTIAGADFFDQMENFVASTDAKRAAGAKSWGEYLSETNPELLEWASKQNQYDYTLGRTNAGSFKTLFGMSSTDQEYEFAERLGGFTSGQLEKQFSKFTDFAKEYSNIASKTGGGARNKREAKVVADMATELKTITDDLGITDDIEKDIGVSLDQLVTNIANNKDSMTSGWGLTGKFFSNLGAWAGGGFTGGALVGASVGAPTGPGAVLTSSIGAVVGLILGSAAGLAKGAFETRDAIEQNEDYEKQIENAYLDMIGALTMYAQNKRKELN